MAGGGQPDLSADPRHRETTSGWRVLAAGIGTEPGRLARMGRRFHPRVPLFDFVELLARRIEEDDGEPAAQPLRRWLYDAIKMWATSLDRAERIRYGPRQLKLRSAGENLARLLIRIRPSRPTIPSRVVSCSTASRRGCSAWTGRGSFWEVRAPLPGHAAPSRDRRVPRGTGAAGRPARPVPDGVDATAQPARPGVRSVGDGRRRTAARHTASARPPLLGAGQQG